MNGRVRVWATVTVTSQHSQAEWTYCTRHRWHSQHKKDLSGNQSKVRRKKFWRKRNSQLKPRARTRTHFETNSSIKVEKLRFKLNSEFKGHLNNILLITHYIARTGRATGEETRPNTPLEIQTTKRAQWLGDHGDDNVTLRLFTNLYSYYSLRMQRSLKGKSRCKNWKPPRNQAGISGNKIQIL